MFFFNCDVLPSRPHRSLASSFISYTLMKKTEKKERNVRKLLQEVSRHLVFVLTAVNYSSVKHPSASISSPPTHKAAVKDLSRRGVVQPTEIDALPIFRAASTVKHGEDVSLSFINKYLQPLSFTFITMLKMLR